MTLPNVAYFSMEIAMDQSLKTYSGGLGFLAGSHMLSAGYLQMPMVGVTMLWSYGYYDQRIDHSGNVEVAYIRKYYDFLVAMALQPKKAVLSDVMLETLSIIAYKQPVTKLEIEKIRGVKSDHAVNKLIEYGLVREVGRLDAPGRPILFGTTEEFLRNFGVQGLDDLPEIDPVQMEDFKAEAEEEIQLQLDV